MFVTFKDIQFNGEPLVWVVEGHSASVSLVKNLTYDFKEIKAALKEAQAKGINIEGISFNEEDELIEILNYPRFLSNTHRTATIFKAGSNISPALETNASMSEADVSNNLKEETQHVENDALKLCAEEPKTQNKEGIKRTNRCSTFVVTEQDTLEENSQIFTGSGHEYKLPSKRKNAIKGIFKSKPLSEEAGTQTDVEKGKTAKVMKAMQDNSRSASGRLPSKRVKNRQSVGPIRCPQNNYLEFLNKSGELKTKKTPGASTPTAKSSKKHKKKAKTKHVKNNRLASQDTTGGKTDLSLTALISRKGKFIDRPSIALDDLINKEKSLEHYKVTLICREFNTTVPEFNYVRKLDTFSVIALGEQAKELNPERTKFIPDLGKLFEELNRIYARHGYETNTCQKIYDYLIAAIYDLFGDATIDPIFKIKKLQALIDKNIVLDSFFAEEINQDKTFLEKFPSEFKNTLNKLPKTRERMQEILSAIEKQLDSCYAIGIKYHEKVTKIKKLDAITLEKYEGFYSCRHLLNKIKNTASATQKIKQFFGSTNPCEINIDNIIKQVCIKLMFKNYPANVLPKFNAGVVNFYLCEDWHNDLQKKLQSKLREVTKTKDKHGKQENRLELAVIDTIVTFFDEKMQLLKEPSKEPVVPEKSEEEAEEKHANSI